MKVTKFAHSCLLLETDEESVLFDPGSFSTSLIDINKLPKNLKYIAITHEHFDHMDVDFIKKLLNLKKDISIVTTNSATNQLKQAGINNVSSTPNTNLSFFKAPHEDIKPLGESPENIGIHYKEVFSSPGDSHSFTETKAILALPITAPWGYVVNAANLATKLKPKYIVPIHDWHWKKEALDGMYDRLEDYFAGIGIKFLKPVDGEPFQIDV